MASSVLASSSSEEEEDLQIDFISPRKAGLDLGAFGDEIHMNSPVKSQPAEDCELVSNVIDLDGSDEGVKDLNPLQSMTYSSDSDADSPICGKKGRRPRKDRKGIISDEENDLQADVVSPRKDVLDLATSGDETHMSSPVKSQPLRDSEHVANVIDSDTSDEGVKDPNPSQSMTYSSDSDADSPIYGKKSRRPRKGIISDEENDHQADAASPWKDAPDLATSGDETHMSSPVKSQPLRDNEHIANFIDSDTSDEEVKDPNPSRKVVYSSDSDIGSPVYDKKGRKRGKERKSNSSDEDDHQMDASSPRKGTSGNETNMDSPVKSQPSGVNEPKVIDSDTSDEGVNDPNPSRRMAYSSDSDIDSAIYDKRGKRRGKERKNNVSRKSKQAAMDEINAEKSRMLRRSDVRLPYHKPKARTLEEFLSRKKDAPEVLNDIKMISNSASPKESDMLLEMREKIVSDLYNEQEEEDFDDEEYVPEEDKTENVTESSQKSRKDSESIGSEGELQSDVTGVDEKLESEKKLSSKEDKCDIDESESLNLIDQVEEVDKGQNEEKASKLKKRFEALGNKFDMSILESRPKLGLSPGDSVDLVLSNDCNDDVPSSEKEKKQDLMHRFLKHANASKKKHVSDIHMLTIMAKDQNESCEDHLKLEKIQHHRKETSDKTAIEGHGRPKHLVLKKSLMEKISLEKRLERKKMEEIARLQQEVEETEEGFADIEDEEDEEEEQMFDDEEENDTDEEIEKLGNEQVGKEEEESDEDDVPGWNRKQKKKNIFVDEEAKDDDDDMDDDQLDNLTLEESEDETQKNDILTKSPMPSLTQLSNMDPRLTPSDERSQVFHTQDKCNTKEKLALDTLMDITDPDDVQGIEDVIGLCSGQFKTQSQCAASRATQESQTDTVIMTQTNSGQGSTQDFGDTQATVVMSNQSIQGIGVDAEDLLKSDADEKLAPGFMEDKAGYSSDDDAVKDSEGSFARKAKRIILPADSDEEISDNEQDEAEEDEEQINENQDEVEYDSEENEITAKPAFKGFLGKKGLRKEFVDNEAEISGSEPESGDEDERGLDRMEIEEGDLDDFDDDEVRDQVGKIHHRQLLDSDKRDIRLFKEAFLEDGDMHSEKTRQRTFRWKDIDNALESHDRSQSDEERDQYIDEEEEKRKMERLERQKWLMESNSKSVEQEEDEDSQFFNLGSKALKKLEKKEFEKQVSKEEEPFKVKKVFTSPKSELPLQTKSCNSRGSFLSRSSTMLSKLATVTKSRDDGRAGTGAKNTKNFVFATITKDSEEAGPKDSHEKKRKAETATKLSVKKMKVDRRIDENNMDSVFGYMK